MEIEFMTEYSGDVADKIRSLTGDTSKINRYLEGRHYGSGLKYLLIRILCLSPRQDDLFPPLPPRYNATARNYMHRGERLEKPAFSFEFDLRLNYQVYRGQDDVRSEFAKDLVESVSVISTNKKIKDFDIISFKADLTQCVKQLGWNVE